jgi:hypothetical protein
MTSLYLIICLNIVVFGVFIMGNNTSSDTLIPQELFDQSEINAKLTNVEGHNRIIANDSAILINNVTNELAGYAGEHGGGAARYELKGTMNLDISFASYMVFDGYQVVIDNGYPYGHVDYRSITFKGPCYIPHILDVHNNTSYGGENLWLLSDAPVVLRCYKSDRLRSANPLQNWKNKVVLFSFSLKFVNNIVGSANLYLAPSYNNAQIGSSLIAYASGGEIQKRLNLVLLSDGTLFDYYSMMYLICDERNVYMWYDNVPTFGSNTYYYNGWRFNNGRLYNALVDRYLAYVVNENVCYMTSNEAEAQQVEVYLMQDAGINTVASQQQDMGDSADLFMKSYCSYPTKKGSVACSCINANELVGVDATCSLVCKEGGYKMSQHRNECTSIDCTKWATNTSIYVNPSNCIIQDPTPPPISDSSPPPTNTPPPANNDGNTTTPPPTNNDGNTTTPPPTNNDGNSDNDSPPINNNPTTTPTKGIKMEAKQVWLIVMMMAFLVLAIIGVIVLYRKNISSSSMMNKYVEMSQP